MLNRITTAMHKVAKQSARQAISTSAAMRSNRLAATARQTVMALGLTAIAILALIFFKPEMADRLQNLSPFNEAIAEEVPAMSELLKESPLAVAVEAPATVADANIGTDLQQQRVTQWISKRYRVAADATNLLVSAAYLTGKEVKLDPLLILAVMAIESRFNPFAESPVGAQGLMQVMSKVHHEKFADMGGTQAALNPVANIKVGALILKEYVARDGSVEGGLKRYVGAAAMSSDAGYGAKVLGEYDRLKAVANGKRISAFATMASRAQPRIQPIQNAVPEKTALEDSRAREKNSDIEQYTAL